MTRAIGYARLSKPRRKKDGTVQADPLSIEIQTDAITAAAEQNGWDLLDVLRDNGKSGAHTRRPALQDALTMLKQGDADMLVIAKFDRLSRDARDWLNLLFDSNKQGWSISVLNDRLDTSTATGWLHAAIRAVFAEYERRLISERTRDALAIIGKAKQLGKPSDIPKSIERLIMREHNNGTSASEIARILTAKGKPSPTGRPTWHHSTVARLIARKTA